MESGYSVIGNLITRLRLKFVFLERMISMRINTSRRLSAADFPLPLTRFVRFSCPKLETLHFLIGCRIRSSSCAHSFWNSTCRSWQKYFVKYCLVSSDAALLVVMFTRHNDVETGSEKGSHELVTALYNSPFQSYSPVAVSPAAPLLIVLSFSGALSQAFHIERM